MEPKIAKIEARLDDHDRRLLNVEALHSQLISLTADLSVLVTKLSHMETSINSISTKVTAIDGKVQAHLQEPAANWKKLMWLIGGAIAGAIMALVINQIGLGG